MSIEIIKKLKNKLKGNQFGFFPTIKRLLQKGGKTFIRGLFFKLLSQATTGFPLFLGKGTLIHNTLFLKTGSGVYIGDYSYIDCLSKGGIILGNNVTIREFAWCQLTSNLANPGELIDIGDNTYIGPRVILGAAAPLIIGKNCQIGSGVNFIAENHEFSSEKDIFQQGVTRKGIKVQDDCWIGNNVVVIDGVTIGEGSVIGAGAIVTKDIPKYSVAVGNPAKVIKRR
ncbi:DapH/DapD/GlmU-related protein [Amphritea sp. 1_MG-2023]|uniref:acyltransferase n=1 Tax=Amphritea sp. 1_MG-2023 TaxID=3062670 RepID=UPI0026E1D042|nr:DapH/DapD/GlmU-related protein [Amphritea sp. 1_MG-2023]MDO6565142.1 DapH/DapD/GlmU-related protein [Amphritea sp. 1_MG-2023]